MDGPYDTSPPPWNPATEISWRTAEPIPSADETTEYTFEQHYLFRRPGTEEPEKVPYASSTDGVSGPPPIPDPQ